MSKFRLRGRRQRNREKRVDSIPLRAFFPNLITSMAACSGILSVSFSSEGRFLPALYALAFAALCDGLDGRVARLLKASSKLGAELDSLADFVNFGVAPAMFMYFWLSGGPTHVGVTPHVVRLLLGCALFYAMCDCFRLARFNTMLEQPPVPYWKPFFTGVPAPGGCWLVLTPAIFSFALHTETAYPRIHAFLTNPYFGMAVLLVIGSLMASRLPTLSLKTIHVKGRRQAQFALLIALLIIGFLVADHLLAFAILGFGYILTIPITVAIFLKMRRKYFEAENKNRE